MSKIGRRPIELGSVQVEVHGSEVRYKGKNGAGVYELPAELTVVIQDGRLCITAEDMSDEVKQAWGLHRALLANKISGADKKFERILKIVGLGYKVVITGSKLQFTLGYSHKIDYELPEIVSAEADKIGQLLTMRSIDKEALGLHASKIRALRPPEPYKGTGVQYSDEVVRRKAGKAK